MLSMLPLNKEKAVSSIIIKFEDRWTILLNAKSSDDTERMIKLSASSSLVFEQIHKHTLLPVIPRNALAFRQGIYDVILYQTLNKEKAISSIIIKFEDRWTILLNAKSSDDIEGERLHC